MILWENRRHTTRPWIFLQRQSSQGSQCYSYLAESIPSGTWPAWYITNVNYIVVFKNPRDRAQIRHLAPQVYPDDPKFLEEAYYDATSRPHGYLLLDLKQSIPMSIDFERFFPRIRFVTSKCHVDFPADSYKSWERVIVYVSRRFFLTMSDEKLHRATKIVTHSIGKRNACLLAALYHLNKIQRTTFLHNADEKLIRCICECVFNTLKGNVSLEWCEKNRLTKYKKALRRKT